MKKSSKYMIGGALCIVAAGAGFYFYRRNKVKKAVEKNIPCVASELKDVEKKNPENLEDIICWPCDSKTITCGFGPRKAPIAGASTEHKGVDIATEQGSSVYAVKDGTVDLVWNDTKNGGGYSMRLKHADGLTSHFCHLSKFLVNKGDAVKRGQPIALSGGQKDSEGAGNSTGPHLHFMLKNNGTAFDPMTIFKF